MFSATPGTSADERRTKWNTENALARLPAHVSGRMLVLGDGTEIGPFSGHWPAVAAMLRLSDPGFVSLGGDKPSDLAIEREAASHSELSEPAEQLHG